jgi:hypothetical protein
MFVTNSQCSLLYVEPNCCRSIVTPAPQELHPESTTELQTRLESFLRSLKLYIYTRMFFSTVLLQARNLTANTLNPLLPSYASILSSRRLYHLH